jgi:hypothetical protein
MGFLSQLLCPWLVGLLHQPISYFSSIPRPFFFHAFRPFRRWAWSRLSEFTFILGVQLGPAHSLYIHTPPTHLLLLENLHFFRNLLPGISRARGHGRSQCMSASTRRLLRGQLKPVCLCTARGVAFMRFFWGGGDR